MSQTKSNISEQAEKYAEVIVGHIADNFTALEEALTHCTELKILRTEYEKLSPNNDTLMDIDKTKERLEIIEKSIGDLICDKHNTVEPLAVGLFGEWGSGKTHQLKLIQQRIKYMQSEEYKNQKSKNKVCFPKVTIPIFFNAWRFEKEEHIILPLFQMLLDAVEQHERTWFESGTRSLKSTIFYLKNVLLSLHKGINPLSLVKTIKGVVTGDIEDLAKFSNIISFDPIQKTAQNQTDKEQVGEQSLSDLVKPDQLESIYLNIPQWIEKITLFENVNFVFLIDDLDRCLPENTLKMLESIKLFLDVPSCAFVLAVDDDVVERGVVHHYRDYLSIYHHKDTEDSKGVMQHELPITGHEYLEKMIQLPIRLPVIDEQNAREFLESCSGGWIGLLANQTTKHEAIVKSKDESTVSEELLDYFAKVVPAKPRKLKRVAKLFETKLHLLEDTGHTNCMLLAKVVLLELFAPKLLRFMLSYDMYYATLFLRLEEFKHIVKNKNNSLEDTSDILTHIDTIDTTVKFQTMYKKLLLQIQEHYSGRVKFELDDVFDNLGDAGIFEKELKLILESHTIDIATETTSTDTKDLRKTKSIYSDDFEKLLFSKDKLSWQNAFKEDKDFASSKVRVTDKELKTIKTKAKEHKLDKDANWLKILAPHCTLEQVKELLYFELAEYQVTFEEYDNYCESEKDNKIKKPSDNGWGRGNRPVINVSWNDIQAYIKWMNGKEDGYIYALPSKVEWELACNLGRGTKWHFGDDESQLKEYAWYDKNSSNKTHLVGELKENELGLFDMHGNVWEWCEDWYDEDKDTKVLKGGSWYYNAQYTQTSFSNWFNPDDSYYDFGFRLHRTLS